MSSWLCELFMSVTKIYADVINGILTPEQSSDVLDPQLAFYCCLRKFHVNSPITIRIST